VYSVVYGNVGVLSGPATPGIPARSTATAACRRPRGPSQATWPGRTGRRAPRPSRGHASGTIA